MLFKLIVLALIIVAVLLGFRFISSIRKPKDVTKNLEFEGQRCNVCGVYNVAVNADCMDPKCPHT
ncbi:MAG: hypothetical protein VXY05_02095 [Pseudomonadota bacterium]|nr:hypothetical protein [Pseudomonadota bacterium]